MSHVEIWFVTGSQHLYGPETLKQVEQNSQLVVAGLNQSGIIPLKVTIKPIMTDPDSIRNLCLSANSDPNCGGLILWMHTFSPAKMWINGLRQLAKPFLHLHTQFNQLLPWSEIDMDFMNLNQAAHGDREAGFLHTRLRLPRKVVAGHWSDPVVQARIGAWASVVQGWSDLQGAKFARFGDNMREVSVTEGDKVSAQATFGFSVNGYGVGDLVEHVNAVATQQIDHLIEEYETSYELSAPLGLTGNQRASLIEAARIEAGMRSFLTAGGFKGFTTTFEDLHGLTQLPGLAVQRLMADGYGFGAEGDWKTAAMLRFAKAATAGRSSRTSFMEDYTYHLDPKRPLVLGAHMLEICPSIASQKPKLEVHPLGIGGKADPVRLVFDAPAGPAVNASLVDLGNRFRLIVNEVQAIVPPERLPNLPVARAVWECKPNFSTAVEAWIHSGGAHHTVYTYDLTSEHFTDFAEIAGIELVLINEKTDLAELRKELRFNEVYYHLKQFGP